MGRYKGTFQNPANYEPLIAAPFDARTLVDTKADLIAAKTWQQKNGDLWIYEGMEVIVKDEHCLYILNNPISYFLESSWTKGAKYEDIVALEKKIGAVPEGTTLIDLINAIEGGGGDCDCPEYVEGDGIDIVENEFGQRVVSIEDGSISDDMIESVSVEKIVQKDGATLILNGGKAK